MSLKITSDEASNIANFRGVMKQPKMVKDFFVWIPELYTSPFRVFNAKLPTYSVHTDSVFFLGESVKIPTHHEPLETWNCSVYEDDWATTNLQLTTLYSKVNNYTYKFSDIIIFVTHSVFLSEKLANVLPSNKFTDILNLLLDELPTFFYVLQDSYVKSSTPSDLDWESPTTNLVWRLEFDYSSIIRFGSPKPEDLVNVISNLVKKLF